MKQPVLLVLYENYPCGVKSWRTPEEYFIRRNEFEEKVGAILPSACCFCEVRVMAVYVPNDVIGLGVQGLYHLPPRPRLEYMLEEHDPDAILICGGRVIHRMVRKVLAKKKIAVEKSGSGHYRSSHIISLPSLFSWECSAERVRRMREEVEKLVMGFRGTFSGYSYPE